MPTLPWMDWQFWAVTLLMILAVHRVVRKLFPVSRSGTPNSDCRSCPLIAPERDRPTSPKDQPHRN